VFKVNNKTLIFSVLVCFSLLLACVLFSSLRNPVLNTFKSPFSVFTFMRRELSALIFFHHNFTQNELLRKEVDFLRNKLNMQKEFELENMRLKNTLSLKQASKFKLIVARVIARSAQAWSSSVIIDKGRYNGIKNGMVVINYLGLVGRVVETTKATSTVLLINDPNLAVSGVIQRSRQEGLVCGAMGTNLIMKYLSEDSDVKVQDTVITSGLNETYPKGLVIGTVTEVGRDYSGLSRYALIKPAVDLSNIEELLIIIQ
jgi:rod shape-determining protein MreC